MKKFFVLFCFISLSLFGFPHQENKEPTLEQQYRHAINDLYEVCICLDSFYVYDGKFPEKLEDCVPLFMSEKTLKDPWGKPYFFKACIVDGKKHILAASGGSDGVFLGWEQKGQYLFKNCKDKDIIFNYADRFNLPFGPKLKK